MTKIRLYGLERRQLRYTMIKLVSIGPEKSSIGYTMIKLGQMVLKGVNWLHNT